MIDLIVIMINLIKCVRVKIGFLMTQLYRNTGLSYSKYTGWIFISFDSLGIEFPYKGDEIIWLWPWRRENTRNGHHDTNKYVSIISEGYFNSLDEIDEFWNGFELACQTDKDGELIGPDDDDNNKQF
jgi:hypothetical protein